MNPAHACLPVRPFAWVIWLVGLSTAALAEPAPVPVPDPAPPATVSTPPLPANASADDSPGEGEGAEQTDAIATEKEKEQRTATRLMLIPTGAAPVSRGTPDAKAKTAAATKPKAPASPPHRGLVQPSKGGTAKPMGNSAPEAGSAGEMVKDGGKLWVRDTPLNEIFQYLAEQGGFQYFHNSEIEGSGFMVTGHLNDGDSLGQMEELGLMYGVTVYQKGSTIYALTQSQLALLPQKPMQYHLKYLRPSDIEQIKTLLQPVLTPGSASIDYEKKTNTLVVFDNEQRLKAIQEILCEMDVPRQQIAIETKILRVRSTARNRIGVDWNSVLGDGLTIEAMGALNTLFNLPELDLVDKLITANHHNLDSPSLVRSNVSGLVLSPVQVRAVLHALNSGKLVQQESCPSLITEDNEEGLITIIDRVPIIISTVTQSSLGPSTATEEVRYRVDPQDSTEPATSREIGVTVSVTPTILPDNTIRMQLRPRTAQIVGWKEGRQSGNSYPQVNESTIQTTARIPNGHSLLIGGVYDSAEENESGKVPLLGDAPVGRFLFKDTNRSKEQTSLVFIVTPTTYEPVSVVENDKATRYLHEQHVLPPDHASPDRRSPGFNYESRPFNALANLFRRIPPTPPANTLNPDHPVHQVPVNDETYTKTLRLRNVFYQAAHKRRLKSEAVPAPAPAPAP